MVMNSFRIEAMSDTLILLQKGINGFEGQDVLKYNFISESSYQNAIELKPTDIYSIRLRDTVYIESPKTYASYKGTSFQSYIYDGIRSRISMDKRSGRLIASFLVSKLGIVDSVKIYEGIDEEFNKRFLKVFNSAKKDWKPALLNGKPVAVQMMLELKYSTSETVIPTYFSSQKASAAFDVKDYELALYYYNKAIENSPADKFNLYRRGMCKMFLGNLSGACQDWNIVRALGGSMPADAALEKYCN